VFLFFFGLLFDRQQIFFRFSAFSIFCHGPLEKRKTEATNVYGNEQPGAFSGFGNRLALTVKHISLGDFDL